MKGINIIRKVTLTLTADQWGLYGMEGREMAASFLNLAVAKAINTTTDQREAYALSLEALSGKSNFGAADGEGEQTLGMIFDKVYGRGSW